MNLEVAFYSETNQSIMKDRVAIGLDKVDEIRKITLLPNLSLDVFAFYSNSTRKNFSFQINENTARTSRHFKNRNRLQIEVPDGFLNSFVVLSPEITQNDDGKIEKVDFKWEIDKEAVLEAWEEAGFPLKWGFE